MRALIRVSEDTRHANMHNLVAFLESGSTWSPRISLRNKREAMSSVNAHAVLGGVSCTTHDKTVVMGGKMP